MKVGGWQWGCGTEPTPGRGMVQVKAQRSEEAYIWWNPELFTKIVTRHLVEKQQNWDNPSFPTSMPG